ncbi:MAG: transcriptional repressor [Planctomycetota bacterium]
MGRARWGRGRGSGDVAGKHALLREQFEHTLRSMGEVVLPEDFAIVDAVLSTEEHCTAEDIRDAVAEQFPEVSLAHVRRTLRLLCDLGIATRMEARGRVVYEHIHMGEHHGHFICLRCGRILEFSDQEIEARQMEHARRLGFHPLVHRLEIRGICAECASGNKPVKTLADAEPGETVCIRELLGGHGFVMRLTEMGLGRGVCAQVVQNAGRVVLDVRGARVGIGLGMANKIIVSAGGNGAGSGA